MQYSSTVVRGTCPSFAALVHGGIIPLSNAATVRNWLDAGIFLIAPSALISCC